MIYWMYLKMFLIPPRHCCDVAIFYGAHIWGWSSLSMNKYTQMDFFFSCLAEIYTLSDCSCQSVHLLQIPRCPPSSRPNGTTNKQEMNHKLPLLQLHIELWRTFPLSSGSFHKLAGDEFTFRFQVSKHAADHPNVTKNQLLNWNTLIRSDQNNSLSNPAFHGYVHSKSFPVGV